MNRAFQQQSPVSSASFRARPPVGVVLSWVLALLAPPAMAQRSADQRDVVLIIPVRGEINFKSVALVRRGLSEAKSVGVDRVILDIDTPGGRQDSMDEIITILKLFPRAGNGTIAYITQKGLSAGAMIAIACERIFMARGAEIGAVTPVFMGGVEGLLEDEVRAKFVSAIRARIRTLAEEGGNFNPLLAEAMVDRELVLVNLTYVDKKDGLTKTRLMPMQELQYLDMKQVEVLTQDELGPQPLTLTTREAVRYGVAETAETLDDLLRTLGLEDAEIRRFEPSWSEELAGFLYHIRYLLLVLAVVLAVFAFKVPGTGLLEGLAALMFLLYFGQGYLVGLAALTEILLFVAGVGLVLLELFVIPGTLISGITGFSLIAVSLFLSLQPFTSPSDDVERAMLTSNIWDLILVLLAVIATSIVGSRFLPHIPFFSRLLLRPRDSGQGQSLSTAATSEECQAHLVGMSGEALTGLHPAGRAEIDGQPVDVVSLGQFIEQGTRIRVLKVEGNRVVVEAEDEAPEGGQIEVTWLILMVVAGLLVILAEVFFPSFGVLSIIASILLVGAAFLSFQHGLGTGIAFLVAIGITVPVVLVVAFRLLPRTGLGKHLILVGPTFQPSEDTVRERGLEDMLGKHGVTLTPLRPSGTVRVGERSLDAMTRGEPIEAGTPVVVLSIELAQVVVARKDGDRAQQTR
ncbi:MAG: NfeD family protein [Planctomycetota bacterium]